MPSADDEPVELLPSRSTRSQRGRARHKTSIALLLKQAGVAALIVVGVAELLVITWTLVGRFTAVPSGSLTITSKPVGAQLIVDGVVRGSTPATMSVPEGMHTVEVRSSGPPQIMAVRVDNGGQISRYFELVTGTAPGVVRVDSKPADAKVMIDGTFRGRSPIVVSGLNPGRHLVRIEHENQSREREVLLGPGATASVSVPFDPLPRPTQGHGWVAIWTPVELQATEHGKPIGSSRAGPWQLSAGRHELVLSNAMFGVSVTKTVDVVAARTTSIDAGVPSGIVSISSSPGAEIEVDGDSIGKSSVVNRPVTVGQHDITARHPELGERRVSVTIMPGTTLSLNMELRRK